MGCAQSTPGRTAAASASASSSATGRTQAFEAVIANSDDAKKFDEQKSAKQKNQEKAKAKAKAEATEQLNDQDHAREVAVDIPAGTGNGNSAHPEPQEDPKAETPKKGKGEGQKLDKKPSSQSALKNPVASAEKAKKVQVSFDEPPPPPPPDDGDDEKPNKANSSASSRRKKEKPRSVVSYKGDKADDNTKAELHTSMALRAKRRGDVFVEPIEARDRYTLAMVSKSDEAKELIESALEQNILFNDLGDVEVSLMVGTMKSKKCEDGETLITQGEMGEMFYVVDSGVYDYYVDGDNVGEAKRGDSFGHLALLYNSPRAATVVAREGGKLWTQTRDNFRKIVSATASKSMHEIQDALKTVPLLQGLSDEQLNSLVDCVIIERFNQGDTIIRKGDEGQVFYFIKSGAVECTKIGTDDKNLDLQLAQGDYFGERALMMSEPRAANVIALNDVELIALHKDDFEKHLGSLMKVLDRNLGIRALKSLPILKDFTQGEKNKIVEEFKPIEFDDGEFIVQQGEVGDTFYIIREGEAEVSKLIEGNSTKAVVTTLKSGDYFGEGALLQDESKRAADVIAKGHVKAFALDRASFDRHMNKVKGKLSRHLSRRLDETDDAVKKVQRGVEAQIKFNELSQVKTLGTGTFGRVKLVEHKQLKMCFALKILQKAHIVAYRQQTNVLNEKRIMEECDHPFILRLFKTFKDKDSLYMLLELVQGGELFSLLHIRGGRLGDHDARFYAACVLDAMDYLHERTIVYRDLKPENILIDTLGYAKVVDFGFAKRVKDKTYTLCGTPEYLAPELVLGKGHNKGVDYWALGILVYEMINGSSPFADNINGDHMVIYRNIVRGRLSFPKRYPEKAKDLTTLLLVRESHLRLGCMKGQAQDVKDHTWFKSLDWNDLFRKRMKAPWVPQIKDAFDTTNFEPYDEDDSVEPYHGDDGWCEEF